MNWFIRLLKRLFKRTMPMSAAERYDHHREGIAILIRRLVEYGMSTNWVREITLLADSNDFLAVGENCKVAADEQEDDPDLTILLWKISELAELIYESNPEEEEEDDAAEEE